MSEKADKRSGMLGTIYNMLPSIDDDYAAKLVYTLENKKSLPELQQDIANISAQLSSDSAMTDTIAAKILLDEITLPAALRQLRIYNNATSIAELAKALELEQEDMDLLLNVYASFSSRKYFDVQFATALKDVQDRPLNDEQKVLCALDILLEQARELLSRHRSTPKENRRAVLATADKYHISVVLTADLLRVYTQPEAILFNPEFNKLFTQLGKINKDDSLNASLCARALLCTITPKDAQDITLLSKMLNKQILEEDLMIIACRYLKSKTPKDVLDAFQAVLQRLPHVKQKEENLGLAVKVLLDGTAKTFDAAQKAAQLRRDRIVLKEQLSKKNLYSGYAADIAAKFGGQKDFAQIETEMADILRQLPFCTEADENKELACKVLLGTLSQTEAKDQAQYLRDLKAKTLTKGLAPEVMKNYLGTKPAEEILEFFESSLAPYTFWKSDREKHLFALQTLVAELNGNYNAQISQFVLEMLETGSSLEVVADMLANIQSKKASPEELSALLSRYKQARAAAK